jgi:hypothetical protein
LSLQRNLHVNLAWELSRQCHHYRSCTFNVLAFDLGVFVGIFNAVSVLKWSLLLRRARDIVPKAIPIPSVAPYLLQIQRRRRLSLTMAPEIPSVKSLSGPWHGTFRCWCKGVAQLSPSLPTMERTPS